MATFQIEPGSDGQYYYHLRAAGNNEIILRGEGYTTKSACQAGIQSVKDHAANESRYVRLQSSDAQHYFNLKSSNGEIIGTSETYTTTANRDHAIDLVKKQAPGASTVDLS